MPPSNKFCFTSFSSFRLPALAITYIYTYADNLYPILCLCFISMDQLPQHGLEDEVGRVGGLYKTSITQLRELCQGSVIVGGILSIMTLYVCRKFLREGDALRLLYRDRNQSLWGHRRCCREVEIRGREWAKLEWCDRFSLSQIPNSSAYIYLPL